jgi:hypothetical protein
LLQSLRGRPLENIWLESRLTIQTAKQNDETAQLKSILKSAFFPTKRQAARQRRRAVRQNVLPNPPQTENPNQFHVSHAGEGEAWRRPLQYVLHVQRGFARLVPQPIL